jgi:thioesterase domain-containing protein
MNSSDLDYFLKNNIPMAKHMGISILSCDENSLVSSAPLEYNKNDKGTGFAGSIFSICAMSGWSYIRFLTLNEGLNCNIMMHASEIIYHKPVLDDFNAEAKLNKPGDLKKFIEELKVKGKSRIEIKVSVSSSNDLKAEFTGSIVAILK